MEEKKTTKTKWLKYNSPIAVVPVIAGVILNFLGSVIASRFDFPLYLDNVGTIIAGALGGYLPGIFTAVVNNMINYMLNSNSIYYASVSALIAISAAYFYRKTSFRSISGMLRMILLLVFIAGFFGGTITWFLSGAAVEGYEGNLYRWFLVNVGLGTYWSHILSTSVFEIIDKSITVIAAFLIVLALPESFKNKCWFSGWRQTPQVEEAIRLENNLKIDGRSLNNRIAMMLVFTSLAMALVVTGVSTSLFRDYSKEQHFDMASGIAKLAADAVEADRVNEFIKKGEEAEGYKEIEDRLYAIRESSPDIEYVYVYKILENGCQIVFDLDTAELQGEDPGSVIPFDESFLDKVPDLLAGKRIEPIESDDTYGWLLTVYEPVYDSAGRCVCYAAADVKVDDIIEYEQNFATRVVLLFFGFFILILVIGLWLAKYHVILPINSMASWANKFAYSEGIDDEALSEQNLKGILDLNIETGDEVQDLYESFCKMTADTVDHMKDIKNQAEEISQMQRGLIITLADMVEGRDSDTGNHIRKTAAYARIVCEALKRKGYYSDQLTDQFIDDVVRSAPLHDIGKISVSDVVLNKPGKLTDEEYEIMKTHAAAGGELIDRVIKTVNGASYLAEARNLAASHHEKWDGRGYPEGLKGEDIPLSARIMAIADVFDALSSKRVYKDAMPFEKAVSIIQNDSGTHFDPKCVEAFMDSLDEVKGVLDYYNELEENSEKDKDLL